MSNLKRCAFCEGWVCLGHNNAVWIQGAWYHNPCAPWHVVPCPLLPLLADAWALLPALERTRPSDGSELRTLIGWLHREARRWPGEVPWRLLETSSRIVRLLDLWAWRVGFARPGKPRRIALPSSDPPGNPLPRAPSVPRQKKVARAPMEDQIFPMLPNASQ